MLVITGEDLIMCKIYKVRSRQNHYYFKSAAGRMLAGWRVGKTIHQRDNQILVREVDQKEDVRVYCLQIRKNHSL